jgi:hypothetical protein
LAVGLGGANAAPDSTNAVTPNRILLVAPSSMPITAGTVILTIGALHRTGDVYTGDYRIKVSPYFFKNERGRLAIVVSDQSMAAINEGKVVGIFGTATTSGKRGECRHIEATATPVDINHGTLRLWFMAGNRKMIFNPTYHFSGRFPTKAAGLKVENSFAYSSSPGKP